MPTLQSAQHEATSGQPGATRPGQVLAMACAGPLVTGYVGIAAMLALVMAMAPGTTLSTAGVLRAACVAWLAGYHVPVHVAGHELGMLPLLPTVLLLALVGRSAGTAAARLDWTTPRAGALVAVLVGAAHGLFAVVLAVVSGGASPVVAFFAAGVLASAAATVGTARQCRLDAAVLSRADAAAETGVRAGILAVAALAAVGAVVFAAAMAVSWSRVDALFSVWAPGFGAGLGMCLLSLAYLPNVIIGTTSFAAGPGFAVGHTVLAQWRFHGGPVPAVPVLAPVPPVEAHWWVFLMVLPVSAGVLAGLRCRALPGRAVRLRAVGVAAVLAGVAWLVLAALAGGALAGGPFDPVTVPAGSLAVAVALFVAVPGAVTVLSAGRGPVAEDPGDTDGAPDEEAKAGPEPEQDTA